MSGHTPTPLSIPYALSSDQLVDWPATSLELANWIAAHGAARELVNIGSGSNFGPTGVSSVAPGDALLDLGSVTTRAVPHWLHITCAVSGNAAGALALNVYDGPSSTPGNFIGAVAAVWVDGVRPVLIHGRLRFNPVAGTRNYHVRHLNTGAAGTLFTYLNGSVYNLNASIAEIPK